MDSPWRGVGYLINCRAYFGFRVESGLPAPTQIHQDAAQWLAAQTARDDGCVCLRFAHAQYYLPDAPTTQLIALLAYRRRLPVAVVVFEEGRFTVDSVPTSQDALQGWAQARQLACVDLTQPLVLSPVHIPKPWGQEIWFTGIESRGQSGVRDDSGHQVPLPWLLALLPEFLTAGQPRGVTLLKILDPLPEPVFGDLYFEMHQQKQEVYVVTRVDDRAWPEGVGGIRLGFCQAKRSQYSSDAAFKSAYLAAVQDYQRVRNQIDGLLDQQRLRAGIALNAAVPTVQLKSWLTDIPQSLIVQEQQLRAQLDSFAAVRSLAVGDVVRVPCYTPHSLLHGVTTVEFQTPVYERQILSFAQKVLTQSHWDTAAAMAAVNLDAPEPEQLPLLADQDGCRREQVVAFDDFSVERVNLLPGASINMALTGRYALIMGVAGALQLANRPLPASEAHFVAASSQGVALRNGGSEPAVALVSVPN